MFKLTIKDYKTILQYYNINYNELTNKEIKQKAEDILATKLCKCIKKIQTKNKANESKTIPICRESVVTKKGLHIYNFTCKNKPTLRSKKGTRKKLSKLKKTLKIKQTKDNKSTS